MGQEYARQGAYKKSLEQYKRVINYSTSNSVSVAAQSKIAEIYEQYLKDYEEAIKAYEELDKISLDRQSKLKPKWSIARIYAKKLVNFKEADNKYDLLFSEYEKDLVNGPKILLEWAELNSLNDRYGRAAKIYQLFLKSYPNHKKIPRVVLSQGQIYLSSREGTKASSYFKKVIEDFGDMESYKKILGEAYYGLGESLEIMDDLKGALAAYKQGLDIYPNKEVIQIKINRVEKRQKKRNF